ncbi:MAG: peptide ABC transporter substrate-binding protein, partial [Pseudomonadota bacterium]
MSSIENHDTDAGFASSAGRTLLVYGLAAVAIVILAMFALQALASLVGSSTVAAQAIDRANNSISISIREEPPQLNSTRATDAQSGMVLGHVIEGLTRMDMSDRLAPGVATHWEITPTKATFWLRENAKWNDGAPVTAHDFVFAWQTVLNPETASRYAFLLFPIQNGEEINSGKMPVSDLGVRALDDFTLEVDLARPTPFFAKMVTFQTYAPVREDFYTAMNGEYGASAQKLLFNGPFMISDWVQGSQILMDRNPHYWDQARIHLDRINIAYITSDVTATLNFFKDKKIAYTTLGAENLDNAMEQRWQIQREQDGTVFYMEFNHIDGRLTRSYHLRAAMQLVLDMEELVYKVTKLPGYLPCESLFPGWLMGEDDYFRKEYPVRKITMNETLAREHLAKAKVELGIEGEWPELVLLSGDNPVSNIQSEWVQGTLRAKLGLSLKIDKQIF